MKWSEFSSKLDGLLAVERRRLGAQAFIDQQIRLALGDVQRLLEYYRTGIVTTFEPDDLERDGFASRGRLPRGSNTREAYHVKTGSSVWVRRPLYTYPFSNRNDLRAGVVDIGCSGEHFRIAIDPRSQDFWVYPLVTDGYAVQVVWDAVLGRGSFDYRDTDEVPFDEPVLQLVYDWVKMRQAIEVDRDPRLAETHRLSYRAGIATLYSEISERSLMHQERSTAECSTSPCSSCHSSPCACETLSNKCEPQTLYPEGSPCPCPEVTLPQAEWVMFGNSGQRSMIEDTRAVAAAVLAMEPEFIVHLGDASYPTSLRPGSAGSAGSVAAGASSVLYDLLLKHYRNYINADAFYLALGDHDLETRYGTPTIAALPEVRRLIGETNLANALLMYEFARGPVHFFVLNSGTSDNDSNAQFQTQAAWLTDRAAAASEPWKIVVFHRPAHTSDDVYYPGSSAMQSLTDAMPELGIDLVVSAHAGNYERILDQHGLTHVICGLGGATKTDQAPSVELPGSQAFYAEKCGFLRFAATDTFLAFTLRTVNNEVIDTFELTKSEPVEIEPGPPDPPESPLPMYWGISVAEQLEEAEITALSNTANKVSPVGVYNFPASNPGYGYFVFAWPDAWQQPVTDNGFVADGFPLIGDFAGSGEGYTGVQNGWGYDVVTFANGTPYRVFRSLYLQQLQATIAVTV